MTSAQSSSHEIDSIGQRAQRYWYLDGTAEIAASIVFLLIGLLFAVEASIPEGSAGKGLSAFGLPILTIGGYFIARFVVNHLKERYTYPRTGYIAYPETSPDLRRRSALLAAGIAFVVAFLLTRADIDAWLPAFQGVSIAIFLAYMAYRMSLGRFTALAMGAMAIGVLVSWAGTEVILGTALTFGGIGLLLLASGSLAFRSYLQKAPAPVEED